MAATAILDGMMLMREVGDVSAVEDFLSRPELIGLEAADAESARRIADAREWLVDAKEFERLNGTGSKLDRQHRFWVEVLEPIGQKVAAMHARRPNPLPDPITHQSL